MNYFRRVNLSPSAKVTGAEAPGTSYAAAPKQVSEVKLRTGSRAREAVSRSYAPLGRAAKRHSKQNLTADHGKPATAALSMLVNSFPSLEKLAQAGSDQTVASENRQRH